MSEDRRWDSLKYYLIRILKLYAVWFAVLLPYTVILRKYYVWDKGRVIRMFVSQLILGSTFPVSWYLMATIIGTLVVFILSRLVGDWISLVSGLVLYVLCCLMSNYGNLYPGNSWIIQLRELYPTHFYCSFPVSIFWIVLGKLFAGKTVGTEYIIRRKAYSVLAFMVSLLLLATEQMIIKTKGWSYTNDCYLFLIPACFFLFHVLLSTCVRLKNARMLRCFSTITYVIHLTVGNIMRQMLRYMGVAVEAFPQATLLFVFVVGVCWLLSFVICKLEVRYKWLGILH